MHASQDIAADIRAWFAQWEVYIRGRDFESARALFHADIAAFGTHMPIVHGLQHLETEQWRNVWPRITDFHFSTETVEVGASGDGRSAWALIVWTSTGYDEDGHSFARPGRATIIFAREHQDDPWRAIHTHFSLAPGTPPRTYGTRGNESGLTQ